MTHRRIDSLQEIEKSPIKNQLNNSFCDVNNKQPSNRKPSLLVDSVDGASEKDPKENGGSGFKLTFLRSMPSDE